MIVDLSKRWMNDSMPCLKGDPEAFFSDHGTESLKHPSPRTQEQWNRAKAVCATCPVLRQCARDNLGEVDGVWGGMDPAQRFQQRSRHGHFVRELTGSRKEEYAQLAYMLRMERHLSFSDVGRIIGLSSVVAQYLSDWWKAELDKTTSMEGVIDLTLPEPEVETESVVDIRPNAAFPSRPPKQGDCWVRHGRRVVWGYYLGQTDDDQWFQARIRVLSGEYSRAWIKAEDIKLVKDVTRVILERAGDGSRIYGTMLSRRGTSQAG